MLLIFWPVSIYARPKRLRVSVSLELDSKIRRLILIASFQLPDKARSMACRELSISVKVYGGVVK